MNPNDVMRALESLGLEATPTMVQHFEVLIEAQTIYQARYGKYKDMPIKRMGWRGTLTEFSKCADRALILNWNQEAVQNKDDILDGINYAVHTIRQSEECNRDGILWTFLEPGRNPEGGREHPQKDEPGVRE